MPKGLTSSQADQLLSQVGLNVIKEQKKKPFIIKVFDQFNNFLTILLIFAAFLSFFIGEPIDGILISGIVILNAFFGLYQEKKAEESIAMLKKMTVARVRVVRDGRETEIDSRYLVPGDVVFIEEGTKITADGIILETFNLEVNESALTGESLPVIKNLKDGIYSGTIIAKGRGLIRVTETGMKTKFGQIAQNLFEIDETATPLQKKLNGLTRLIGIVGIFVALAVFAISYLEGLGYFPAFLLSISLAVAVVPEGLPAVMTITLSIGVKEMAKRKAIIRRLSAIEAIGNITLIATDKTGTLTTNKMNVKEVYVNDHVHQESHLPSLNDKAFSLLVLDGILCSTASLVYVHDHGRWDILGDPTEGALLFLSQKVGLVPDMVKEEWRVIDEESFDSVTKKMSVVVKKGNETINFTKGAPESILKLTDRMLMGGREVRMGPKEKEAVEKQVDHWAGQGLRVLAFAYDKSTAIDSVSRTFPASARTDLRAVGSPGTTATYRNNKLIFLGMVAIHDAPRPEVVDAVRKAKAAGIKIVMITGDNEKTAEAVGLSSGIINDGDDIITGEQIDKYSDEDLSAILSRVKIFARTSPFQKFRIVKLYQKSGEVVAVTGDGVNDAIALKQADVGIAMGLVGTDVARETADMIITDDNFATIVSAVEEGRNIIKNLKNSVKYLLSCNISEASALIIGLFLGLPALFNPIQLLYINLITDGIPALALAFSPRHQHYMQQAPEKELTLLKKIDRHYIFSVGILGSLIVVLAFYLFKNTTSSFTVLTLIQSFIFIDLWLSHTSLRKNYHKLISGLFLMAFSFPFIIQFFIIRTPFLAGWFKVKPVSIFIYFQLVIFSSLIFIGIKMVKKIIKI